MKFSDTRRAARAVCAMSFCAFTNLTGAFLPLSAAATEDDTNGARKLDSHCSWRHKKDIQSGVLKGNVAESSDPGQGSWMDKPVDEISKAFIQYSSTGGHDLVDEISPQFFQVIGNEHFNGWSHDVNATPGKDVLYPGWSAWQGGVHQAMYQLRWELWTDPKQGICRLGQKMSYPGGSPMWDSPSGPQKGVLIQKNSWEPGLSKHAYFKGNARVLVQFYPNRKLQTRLLSSTLSDQDTQRLIKSIEALNGHPLLTYPRSDVKVDAVAMVINFGFDDVNSVW